MGTALLWARASVICPELSLDAESTGVSVPALPRRAWSGGIKNGDRNVCLSLAPLWIEKALLAFTPSTPHLGVGRPSRRSAKGSAGCGGGRAQLASKDPRR